MLGAGRGADFRIGGTMSRLLFCIVLSPSLVGAATETFNDPLFADHWG